MENNQTDFMKNRPVAAYANQTKDVYGSQKKSTRTTITVILIVLMVFFIILSLVNTNWFTFWIFTPVLVGLIIALIVGRRADRYNMPVEPHDSPEALFKEHDE